MRASVVIRAPIDEALCRWSEFSALRLPSVARARIQALVSRRVDFEALPEARSRVTLELAPREALPEPTAARRALEDHLVAFEGFFDESGLLPCRNARC